MGAPFEADLITVGTLEVRCEHIPELVFEQDDSLLSWDNQHLIEFTRAAGYRDTLGYQHGRASDEHLLAIPDAIASCWAKGGDWAPAPSTSRDRCTQGLERPRTSGKPEGTAP